MSKIIAVLNQKGGAGKTTLSTNLARALQLAGDKVLLVDSDPQGSARDWNAAGNGDLLPVIGLDRSTLAKDIQAIQDNQDWLIIDGAPQIAELAVAAIKCADVICEFCGYLAQVKSNNFKDINVFPKTVLGAAWGPQKERMDAGIFFPLFIVLFSETNSKEFGVYYLSADMQTKEMFVPRKKLSVNAKRAG